MSDRYYWEKVDLTRDSETGLFLAPDGCGYRTPQDLMYSWGLGLCDCGRPWEVHGLLIDCLKCFDRGDTTEQWHEAGGIDRIADLVAENPKVAAEFIAHFLGQRDMTEHGGSVYGSWLTELGKQFIEVGQIDSCGGCGDKDE